MLKHISFLAAFLLASLLGVHLHAQQQEDSLAVNQDTTAAKVLISKDSAIQGHSPRKAVFRSAVLPGWGQAYNKKYWKIPLVYGALGTTAGIFVYNLKTYRALRQSYIYISDRDTANDHLIDSRFRNLSPESIRSYRNSFRQNMDYSVLFFLLFWGLNVVDAAVDAHLKAFDVGSDITLKIKPRLNLNSTGLSLVLTLR